MGMFKVWLITVFAVSFIFGLVWVLKKREPAATAPSIQVLEGSDTGIVQFDEKTLVVVALGKEIARISGDYQTVTLYGEDKITVFMYVDEKWEVTN